MPRAGRDVDPVRLEAKAMNERLVLAVAVGMFLGVAAIVVAQEDATQEKTMGSPPVYHVLFHSPGPNWSPELSFQEQPGIREHVQYMSGLLQKGDLLMGGPFLDNSGGMMVSRIPTMEQALKVAEDDPAVKSGLLKVAVKPWLVPMTGRK
jgi:uncharacterized protein YciI